MLFEPSKCKNIIEKYKTTEVPNIPRIVSYLISDIYSGEREYLEELFGTVPEKIKTKWRNEFLSPDNGNHIGAWFEIMLYGWLKDFSIVTLEPNIQGTLPDFLVDIKGEKVIIEAKAILIENEQRKQDALEGFVFSALNKIKKNYTIRIKDQLLKTQVNSSLLSKEVINWLDTCPNNKFTFQDENSNFIQLEMINQTNLEKLCIIGKASFAFINPEPLKNPLLKKAKKYKTDYPYLIAVYIESMMLTADTVKTALFGNEKITINWENKEVLNSTIDLSGIHFHRDRILHKSVTGTLVFKIDYSEKERRRFLKARFIQNPYCNRNINHLNLPVESSFIIKDEKESKYEMGWIINEMD